MAEFLATILFLGFALGVLMAMVTYFELRRAWIKENAVEGITSQPSWGAGSTALGRPNVVTNIFFAGSSDEWKRLRNRYWRILIFSFIQFVLLGLVIAGHRLDLI